ncbi:NPC intracellular cholesterol transporter 2 homolog a-like [Coccinella septempunctata]|uniref:NPC intracellular cholesterol transporter 2 homolog a-like n=1 Tax=Coccinella septempunctata TaxID=41139 RepID=UPI001D0784B0|nr:NPC intracellular cholesterol transporter 2 homolog a-like [Coccinella septempunctata]
MELNFVKLSVIVLISCLFVQTESAYFYNCEDTQTLGNVQSIKVTNCDSNDEDSKCILKRGTNITFDLTFKTGVETDTVTSVVHGIIFGESKKFDLPNSNGCVDSGLQCPLAKDSVNTYVSSLPVKKIYPKLSVDVKWELQNKDGKDIVCIIIPAKLA